jgi:2-iminobutanoate/2-iminopropanoate deaminase
MKTPALLLLAAALPGCAATPAAQPRTCFHADEQFEKDVGYCAAVRVGNTLYVSGVAGRGEMPAAIRSVYQRLQKALEANGLAFEHVVKENVYATNLDAFIEHKALRKEFYAGTPLPAATWVQVQRLYVPNLVLEVEVVAEYPE